MSGQEVEYKERLSYEYLLLNALNSIYRLTFNSPESPYLSQVFLRRKAFVDAVKGLLNILTPDLYEQVKAEIGRDPLKYLDYISWLMPNPELEEVPTVLFLHMFPTDGGNNQKIRDVVDRLTKGKPLEAPDWGLPEDYINYVGGESDVLMVKRAEKVLRAIIKVLDYNDLLLTSKFTESGVPEEFVKLMKGGGGSNA